MVVCTLAYTTRDMSYVRICCNLKYIPKKRATFILVKFEIDLVDFLGYMNNTQIIHKITFQMC